MVHQVGAHYSGSSVHFIAFKFISSWLDCTQGHVYQEPSNAVLTENYLFIVRLGKPTYRPNSISASDLL